MNTQKKIAIFGAFALTIGLASSASALSVQLGTGVNVQADVGTSVSANASTSGTASASTNGPAKAAASTAGTDTQTNSQPDASASTSANVSANLAPLFVTQADLTAGMVSPGTDNAASVQSGSDLSGYAAARLQDDNNISQIQTSGTDVAVTYNEPAKVLGLFPVNVQATASVSNDGVVNVSYPWYAFLFSTDASTLQTQLQSSVSADLGGSATADAGFSAQQQAKLISDISTVMQTQANASVAASAGGTVHAQ